jgi:hypothetical protein
MSQGKEWGTTTCTSMEELTWLEGVKLWYNQQDYMGAIELWQDSIDTFDWGDDELMMASYFPVLLLEKPPPSSIYQHTNVARLLLFLAGCQLDAQNIPLARRSLIRCLRCCLRNDDGDSVDGTIPPKNVATATLAFQEWLCSYEEEAHVQNDGETALLMSRKIVDYAIRKNDRSANTTAYYWTSSFQRPGFLYPAVTNVKPYYEGDERPSWCTVLEDSWERIRDEFVKLARGGSTTQHWPAVGSSDHRGGAGQHDHKVVDGDWREVVLFGSGARPDLAPFTSGLIRRYAPQAASLAEQGGGEVIFSVLSPKTRIRAHCGSTNLRLTAHLGLAIPSTSSEDCAIRVADKWHTWEEGKVLVFDDSYEHEVKNMTSSHRAVLLLRFWHPNLDPEKRVMALSKAVESKELDTLRRYNPPLPLATYSYVEKRGLEQSKCQGCWRSGYDTIRVESVHDAAFVCSCGCRIE